MRVLLLPAWLISLFAISYAFALWRRYKKERALIVLGKIVTLVIVAIIYLLITVNFFDDITIDRALSRLSWVSFLMTELCYHYAKTRWKL